MAPGPALRVLAFRPARQALTASRQCALRPFANGRQYAAATNTPNKLPTAPKGETKGPNTHQQEHVSEEAAKMAEITGGKGPDIDGQGTPVEDILKEDPEALKNAPQVVKDDMKKKAASAAKGAKPGTRGFSTMARRLQTELSSSASAADVDPAILSSMTVNSSETAPTAGHKFPLPTLPLGPQANKDTRYDPVVQLVTNLIMREGKKATAQRNMSVILTHLRTASAPTYSRARSLLPGAPPASHLPLHPILYLTLAIDSVAPLLRIRNQRGAAGGGVALQIPVPLGLRQRRRIAFNWILDAASKRANRGSGRDGFATRVAEEIVAVVEGRSGVWEKRAAVHRLATTARSNLTFGARRR